MKPGKFLALVESLQKMQSNVLLSKNEEDSRNGDRLYNFKESARLRQTTPQEALQGMHLKHITSLEDLRNDLRGGDDGIKLSYVLEKVLDNANYNILMIALALDNGQIVDDLKLLGTTYAPTVEGDEE